MRLRRRSSPAVRVLVVIPSFGKNHLTRAVVTSLSRNPGVTVSIVDNRGDYTSILDETVLRPGTNLGWAAGTNLGLEVGLDEGYDAFLCMNNDVELSAGFVAGLTSCARDTGAAIVGPFYDCHWPHQRLQLSTSAPPAVGDYRPRRAHYLVPFVDGTAMYLPRQTLETVGLLDADRFAPWGHGADIDLAARVRSAGGKVVVTRLAYLHHERGSTAHEVAGEAYEKEAHQRMVVGLRQRWGPSWAQECGLREHDTGVRTWRHRVERRWIAPQHAREALGGLKRRARSIRAQ